EQYEGLENNSVQEDLLNYMLERFRAWYQDENVSAEVFLAVNARRPTRPVDFDQRIKAVSNFLGLEAASALSAANKRVSNILAKNKGELADQVDQSKLIEQAEKDLAAQVDSLAKTVTPLFDQGNYQAALTELSSLQKVVDQFFEDVMVMADDEALKNNRLALLSQLRELFLRVADISLLSK
ncbi:DALR anticodon-binding domain-containing protein, partial [Oleiphilus sp. HI0132]